MQDKHLEEVSERVVFLHNAERPRVWKLLVLLVGDAVNGASLVKTNREELSGCGAEKTTLTASRPPQGGMRLSSRVHSSRHSFSKTNKKCDKKGE